MKILPVLLLRPTECSVNSQRPQKPPLYTVPKMEKKKKSQDSVENKHACDVMRFSRSIPLWNFEEVACFHLKML